MNTSKQNLKFRNLFISGPTGVGKTYLAKEILTEGIKEFDRNRTGFSKYSGRDEFKFFNCAELMFLSRDARKGNELYRTCTDLTGLVLDDLGVGKHSDYIPDIIYIILNNRIDRGKLTIVTSNLALGDISELIDDRISSRLSSFEHIKLTGPDRRIPQKET